MEQYFVDSGSNFLKHKQFAPKALKLLVLLYADDTAIMADNPVSFQKSLTSLAAYCKKWKLTVNISKTKVVIFGKRKYTGKNSFYFEKQKLEIIDEFKYLGVIFNYNGSFVKHKKHVHDQALKAMYALLRKSRVLQLPLDIQIDLFQKLVVPILLYACELYGYENIQIIERLQLKYLKYILGLKPSTPNVMVYGETGCFPLAITIKCRIISYWASILSNKPEKLSFQIYNVIFKTFQDNTFVSPWLKFVKNTLDNCGLSNIWLSQSFLSVKNLTENVRQVLKDQYRQEWASTIENSSKSVTYKCFKKDLKFESYLLELPHVYKRILIKFRTSNHKLPIENGRFSKLSRHLRVCENCDTNTLGDEFHFLLECPALNDLRKKYIPKFYWQRPNMICLQQLMSLNNQQKQINLLKFIKEGFETFHLYI